MLETRPKVFQCDDLYIKKNIVTNVPGYTLVLIEYYGYFMNGEINILYV